jgi:hypothetical protein
MTMPAPLRPDGQPDLPAVAFLKEAARHFANCQTGGEDRAMWANVYNAKNCCDIADLITDMYDALRALNAGARPSNWDDEEDEGGRDAWRQLDAAIARAEPQP